MTDQPNQTVFENVSVPAKANVYFGGKVVSHSLTLQDGTKKTLGIIYPGTYHFGTQAAERMEIIHGNATVTLDGSNETRTYETGSYFEVPSNSGFTICVASEHAEYICSFITE
jgi:uncharacterized protein YaiE (UPF0345 family)